MGENTVKKMPQNDQKMTFTQHLGALKKCIAIIAVVFLAAFVVAYIYAPEFTEMVIGINEDYRYIQTDVAEMMTQYIKVSFIVALVVSAPVIVWQIHSFVSPGLTKGENAKFLAVMIGGLLCFAVGAVFCYFIVLPFSLRFFLGLNTIEAVEHAIDLKNYISYVVSLLLSFGLIFEMPVVASLLGSIGLIKSKMMASGRRIVIVLCFVIGAIITPPDVVSQCFVAGPMILLYELSIHICAAMEKSRAKRLAAQGIDPDEDGEDGEKKKESRWASAMAQVEMADARKAKAKSEKK